MIHTNEINPKTGKTPYYKDNAEHKREYQRKYEQAKRTLKNMLSTEGLTLADLDDTGVLKAIQKAQASGRMKTSSSKRPPDGVVYVITNPAWPDRVKIGRAHNGKNRFNDYQTYSPNRDYILEYVSSRFDSRADAEKAVHIIAKQVAQQHSKYDNGEWFKMSVQDAINVIKGVETDDAQTIKD